eukprot:50332-Rhodomonas_salina.1
MAPLPGLSGPLRSGQDTRVPEVPGYPGTCNVPCPGPKHSRPRTPALHTSVVLVCVQKLQPPARI